MPVSEHDSTSIEYLTGISPEQEGTEVFKNQLSQLVTMAAGEKGGVKDLLQQRGEDVGIGVESGSAGMFLVLHLDPS
jgi:hypothetical protein